MYSKQFLEVLNQPSGGPLVRRCAKSVPRGSIYRPSSNYQQQRARRITALAPCTRRLDRRRPHRKGRADIELDLAPCGQITRLVDGYTTASFTPAPLQPLHHQVVRRTQADHRTNWTGHEFLVAKLDQGLVTAAALAIVEDGGIPNSPSRR